MDNGIWVTNVAFTPASQSAIGRGLLGFVSFNIGNTWHVDGVMLRRTLGGHLKLSFPSRRDRQGVAHEFLRPTCARARRAIQRAVLAELGLEARVVSAVHLHAPHGGGRCVSAASWRPFRSRSAVRATPVASLLEPDEGAWRDAEVMH